jgi:hypothetical protein
VPDERDEHRLAWGLAFGFALIYLAFLPPGIYSVDGNSMLAVAESLVMHHSIAISPTAQGALGPDGRTYSTWYPLLSFLAVPFVAAAVPVSRAFHVPLHYVAAVFSSILPALFMAASVGLVVRTAVQLGSSLRGARRAAIVFALGTVAVVYARTFYADPLLTMLVSGAVFLTFTRIPSKVLIAAFLALLAVLAKPTGILLGPLLCIYLFLRKAPARVAALPLVGSVLGLVCYFGYNVVRFGNPFNFGPPYVFSAHLLLRGLAGQLASPGRGIIWYCPPIAMAIPAFFRVAKTVRMEALLIAAVFAAFLGLHSSVPYWDGGWGWGPRYLLPAMPGLMALTGLLETKGAKWLLVLGLAGFFVNAPTLVSFYERYYAEAMEQGVPESQLFWSPARAPALHAWGAAHRVISDARNNDVREIFREAGTPSTTIASSRALRVVAVWWWVLPIVHIPRIIGALVSLVMVVCGGWIIFRIKLPTVEHTELSQSQNQSRS